MNVGILRSARNFRKTTPLQTSKHRWSFDWDKGDPLLVEGPKSLEGICLVTPRVVVARTSTTGVRLRQVFKCRYCLYMMYTCMWLSQASDQGHRGIDAEEVPKVGDVEVSVVVTQTRDKKFT